MVSIWVSTVSHKMLVTNVTDRQNTKKQIPNIFIKTLELEGVTNIVTIIFGGVTNIVTNIFRG